MGGVPRLLPRTAISTPKIQRYFVPAHLWREFSTVEYLGFRVFSGNSLIFPCLRPRRAFLFVRLAHMTAQHLRVVRPHLSRRHALKQPFQRR